LVWTKQIGGRKAQIVVDSGFIDTVRNDDAVNFRPKMHVHE